MKNIRILWNNGKHKGTIRASHAEIVQPTGVFESQELELCFDRETTGLGANTTLVNVCTDRDPFSFLLRDVHRENPIYLPKYSVVVTDADDRRSYEQIVAGITSKGRKTKLQQMEAEEEYSYEKAAKETRDLPGPAWLGISKDMRFFEVGLRSKSCGNDQESYDYVTPRFFDSQAIKTQDPDIWSKKLECPEMNGSSNLKFSMMAGRGIGCRHEVTRRLEDGYLPILNAWNEDEGIRYTMQFFATLESSPFTNSAIRGTDMYAAHAMGQGHMLTDEQRQHTKSILDEELVREEETVMYVRVIAENHTDAPVYSFIAAPDPIPGWDWSYPVPDLRYDAENGYLYSPITGKVLCIYTVDGQPMPQIEMSALLSPGQKMVFEYKIPHRPISQERAFQLKRLSYDEKFAEAKVFWENELKGSAKISLPEKRIEEMIKAGLLHMDIGYFGKNPDKPVVPIVGVYTGIGSESSPGIQFLDTVGLHDLAKRALQFFLELQREDGFIQNHGGYMLETGCVLWTMGEHYRMTRDREWLLSVKDNVVRACDYLLRWREENLGDELKHGNGYGMISGRVSDPMDFFRSFMLNAGTYEGLARASEMLADCDPINAERIHLAAAELKENILESFRANLAKSPVLPAGDGTWYQASAPWTEYAGPLTLYSEGGRWFTHGAFTCRDQESSMYLVLHEVIDAADPLCDDIVKFYTEYLMINNTGFSQSYYSPHPYAHALRGEAKPFLKEFYSGFASLADRETYSFWEHYFHASQHKLHEETWFLMRCRWMLCIEEYQKKTLKLMNVVPRKWLTDGETIEVLGLNSYFGKVSYRVESKVGVGRIKVWININSDGFPKVKTLTIRLPHPEENKKARFTTAGAYCAATETVTLEDFDGFAEFELIF